LFVENPVTSREGVKIMSSVEQEEKMYNDFFDMVEKDPLVLKTCTLPPNHQELYEEAIDRGVFEVALHLLEKNLVEHNDENAELIECVPHEEDDYAYHQLFYLLKATTHDEDCQGCMDMIKRRGAETQMTISPQEYNQIMKDQRLAARLESIRQQRESLQQRESFQQRKKHKETQTEPEDIPKESEAIPQEPEAVTEEPEDSLTYTDSDDDQEPNEEKENRKQKHEME
jgi:hypothetical protein